MKWRIINIKILNFSFNFHMCAYEVKDPITLVTCNPNFFLPQVDITCIALPTFVVK